jgi:hypothetical protein
VVPPRRTFTDAATSQDHGIREGPTFEGMRGRASASAIAGCAMTLGQTLTNLVSIRAVCRSRLLA